MLRHRVRLERRVGNSRLAVVPLLEVSHRTPQVALLGSVNVDEDDERKDRSTKDSRGAGTEVPECLSRHEKLCLVLKSE